jgi:hypothetical protein
MSVTINAGTTALNAILPGTGDAVMITNTASSLAYISLGSDPTLIATSSSTPVLPNSKLLLRCGPLVSYVAAILSSGTGAVVFTRGDGSTT